MCQSKNHIISGQSLGNLFRLSFLNDPFFKPTIKDIDYFLTPKKTTYINLEK
jgi:hypothetical protein